MASSMSISMASPSTDVRRSVKARDLSASAERLRKRCIERAVADRRTHVQRHRGSDVGAFCATVFREELRTAIDEDDDESLHDIDFLLWLEQSVADEVRVREMRALAMYEEQLAFEEEELAALVETHLGVHQHNTEPAAR
mmetsp:Transcript_10498/g.27243  ORF Transcript_10498/g.27243 Transcript_10498/m.27243 type:complete len:140 (+) Transcript_10498:1-420(+)